MKVFTLKVPIEFGKETIEQLEIQSVKAKHLRGFPLNPGFDEMLDLLVKLSGRPKVVIDELDFKDVQDLMEFLGEVLGNSQPSGKDT